MGIYVEDNGTEKLYALTPAAKAWAQSRVRKMRKDAVDQVTDEEDHSGHIENDVSGSDTSIYQRQKNESSEEVVIKDEAFSKLLENLSDGSEDSEKLDGLTENSSDLDEAGSPVHLQIKENKHSTQDVVSQANSEDVKDLENIDRTHDPMGATDALKELIDFEDLGKPTSLSDSGLPKISNTRDMQYDFHHENSSQISKSEDSGGENCTNCSSDCPHTREHDQLLFKSCHNFLKNCTSASNDEQINTIPRIDSEELLGVIWDTDEVENYPAQYEVDSNSEGQSYLRQLVSDHNSHPQNESDIEEILENMEFEINNLQDLYERHNLEMERFSQGTPDNSEPEADDDVEEIVNNGMLRNMNGIDNNNEADPVRVPVFGERWVEDARRIMEAGDWQEELESSSNTSEEEESADELIIETPEETSLVEEESSLTDEDSHESIFEEESVNSVSPVFDRNELQELLKYNPPSVKGPAFSQTVDCEVFKPKPKLEDSETNSSCSSLSQASLPDSLTTESFEVVKSTNYTHSTSHSLEGVQFSGQTHNTNSSTSSSHDSEAATFDLNTTSQQAIFSSHDSQLPASCNKKMPQLTADESTDGPCHAQSSSGLLVSTQEKTRERETREDTDKVRPVTRDTTTLTGGWTPGRHQDSIFSTRDALRNSHEAFVRGRNIRSLLFTGEDDDVQAAVKPVVLSSASPASQVYNPIFQVYSSTSQVYSSTSQVYSLISQAHISTSQVHSSVSQVHISSPRHKVPSPRYTVPPPRYTFSSPRYTVPSLRYRVPPPRYTVPPPR
nr:uncharacterized protein LOC128693411 [Cherax quadricarinatus]